MQECPFRHVGRYVITLSKQRKNLPTTNSQRIYHSWVLMQSHTKVGLESLTQVGIILPTDTMIWIPDRLTQLLLTNSIRRDIVEMFCNPDVWWCQEYSCSNLFCNGTTLNWPVMSLQHLCTMHFVGRFCASTKVGIRAGGWVSPSGWLHCGDCSVCL